MQTRMQLRINRDVYQRTSIPVAYTSRLLGLREELESMHILGESVNHILNHN